MTRIADQVFWEMDSRLFGNENVAMGAASQQAELQHNFTSTGGNGPPIIVMAQPMPAAVHSGPSELWMVFFAIAVGWNGGFGSGGHPAALPPAAGNGAGR